MLAGGGRTAADRDETEADLEAFGAPADVLAARRETPPQAALVVWPENRALLALFLQLPWRHGPFGDRLGLDWVQAEAVAAWTGRRLTPRRRKRLFAALKACEAGALRADAEAAKREAAERP